MSFNVERSELDDLLDSCIMLAHKAGDSILPFWQSRQTLQVTHKSDKTPVTAADLAAHKILYKGLQNLTPDWPILSEEGDLPHFNERKFWKRYWLLDPLDGTRGFLRGSAEFTVNIALIENHCPILGVIYAPVKGLSYYAHQYSQAFRQDHKKPPVALPQKHQFSPPWRLAIGQFHSQQPLEQKIPENWHYVLVRMNSSLKFCALAEGEADAYIRFGPTCEWDTGAGQCILQQTGGITVDLSGLTLQYNCKPSLLNPNFIAISDVELLAQWLKVLT